MISTRIRSAIFPTAVLLISLAGAALIFYSTAWGPWAMSDSAAYLSTARNLMAGHGFGYTDQSGSFLPFTYYPPLFPLVLAVPGLLGASLVSGACLLDMFLFCLLILVLGWGSYRWTRLPWLSLGLSGLLLVSPVLVDTFISLMSEPLFITLGFISLAILMFYLRQNTRRLLFITALVCGLAMLTRYIGIAFLITIILAILLLSGQRLFKRVLDALLFVCIAILPTLASQAWVVRVSAHLAGRSFGMTASLLPLVREYVNRLASVINDWLPLSGVEVSIFPPQARLLVVCILTLMASALIWLRLRDRPENSGLLRLNGLMLIFCTIYPISLGASYVFSSPPVVINSRMLSPLMPALLVQIWVLLAGLIRSFRPSKVLNGVCTLLVLAVFARFIPTTWELVNHYHLQGAGYTDRVWHTPHAFDPLQQIPSSVLIVSNDPGMVLFYNNRYAYDLSGQIWTERGPSTPVFGSGPTEIETVFRAGAALVIFLPDWQSTFGSQAQTRLALWTRGLDLAYASPEFNVYFFSAQNHATICGCSASQEPLP